MFSYLSSESDRWEVSEESVEEGLMWGSLNHLEPNQQYQVRIIALAHDGGDTRPSEPYTFKTAGFGKSSQPVSLNNAIVAHKAIGPYFLEFTQALGTVDGFCLKIL